MKNLTINELEYSCDSKNITLLKINENWLREFGKEGNDLREVLLHLSDKIFNSKDFFVAQKIIALTNLVKSIRALFKEKSYIYSINLVVRNLNAYRNNEKTGKNFIKVQDKKVVINSLIILAFSNSFNDLLKSLYVK